MAKKSGNQASTQATSGSGSATEVVTGGSEVAERAKNKPVLELHNTCVNAEVALASSRRCHSQTSEKPMPGKLSTKSYEVTCEGGPAIRPPAIVRNCLSPAHAKNTYCTHFRLTAHNYRLRVELVE